MKILVISGGHLPIPAVQGGAVETLITDYLDENDRLFHDDIDVISSPVPKALVEKVKKYRYSHFFYLKNQSKNSFYNLVCRFYSKYFHRYIGCFFLNKAIRKVKKLHKDYDIILCENEIFYPLLLKKKFHNSKIVLHLHNDRLYPSTKFYKEIMDSTDKVIVISDYLKSRVCNPDKCSTVYNGIDFRLFQKPTYSLKETYGIQKDDFVFCYVGRIVPEKGISELIDAFLSFSEKYPNTKLLVVGGPSFAEKQNSKFYEQMVHKKNKNILFTGYVDYEKVSSYIDMANVVVVPSIINEAFGLIVIQALIMKRRLIVSDAGALPEILDERYGTVVERKELVNNLYDTMEKEYFNKNTNLPISNRIQKFSKEKYAENIHENLKVML